MSASDRITPMALESLYRVAIKDTLDQSISRRNAEDIQGLRQSLADLERTMSNLRGAVDGLQTQNRELRGTTEGLRVAIGQLRSGQDQGIVDKKTIRLLQTHIVQVDQRQSELETKHEEVERAFEQIAQLMEADIEEAPPPTPPPPQQQQQLHHHQHDELNPIRKKVIPDIGIVDGQLLRNEQRYSPPKRNIPPSKPQEEHTGQAHSRNQQRGGEAHEPPSQWPFEPQCLAAAPEQQEPRGDGLQDSRVHQGQQSTNSVDSTQKANDPNVPSPRYNAFTKHFKETKRKYVEAGKMSRAKEREFIWAFIDGIQDKEACQWLQQTMLESLPSSIVRPARTRKTRGRAEGRIIALDLAVTWDAVEHRVLRRAKVPPFLINS